MKNIQIRKMRVEEMAIAIGWADKEGWNPGLYDADCFYNTDPDGFFVGLIDDEIVSMISAVRYGEDYGFIGFYIVKPEFRGQGVGIQIWDAAMKFLSGRMIGLDGVPGQVVNYQKSGFVYAHRNRTFKGIALHRESDEKGITELTIKDFGFIRDYDLNFVPAERDKFLDCWLSQKESHVLGFVENESLKGYGKIRRCNSGYKIGPLFADNKLIAGKLLTSLQNKIPAGEHFTLDIPELNTASLKLAKDFQMEYAFETARMYKNALPDIDLNKVFGVTTYELG